ncbi:ABC transporter ATP-binding protein [Conyzicola nivalis]
MDSEPDLPEAQTPPPARTPAARVTSTPKKQTGAPRKPAAPRQPRSSTSTTAAAKTGTGAKPATPAKPAAPKTGAAKPATPRTTTPRATTPRSTTPKAATAKPAAAKSVASPNAERPAVRRTPAKKTTTDAAKPAVSTELSAPTPGQSTPADVSSDVLPEAVTAEAPTADTSTTEPPVAKAPAKRPVRRPAAKKPVVTDPVVETEPEELAVVEPVVEVEPAVEIEPVVEVESVVEGETVALPAARETVLKISGLVKRFDDKTAVAGIDLEIEAGSFFGIVGPNGAGKTTTLSMVTGLLRPDAGTVVVHGADVWANPVVAKRTMGVLPDRLRLFDRLTGAQLLYYSGILHGLEKSVVRSRSADLSAAFGLEDSLDRLVSDYSAGMTKKIAIAAAMIHSPRLLVLDEPFESVDPVSAANVIEILQKYVAAGGTVVMSSHTMNLIERICDSVAVVVNGAVLATGTMAEVRGDKSLEDRFVELAGGRKAAEGMEWLHKFSD